ncbi:hypothetical protein BCR39DRAFT_527424 [Naematelia encephala]|uniref:SWR1-complex protein 4 n=1 Tax=Naematelia encephala TaxID=71784 RepID=A0A1Y2BB37_9TREE|nr:hypothetical protein BCR39DRAFT_527424 [Naematelia encephala]
MSSNDIRSILSLPQTAASSSQARRSVPLAKKPEGISRELYALIGDNAPSLAQAQSSLAAVKYRDRPKLKAKSAKWAWKQFSPAARKDAVPLSHWVRMSDVDGISNDQYFAQFNEHGPSVMEYSQFEYDQHLADPDWTPHETAYLFDLLRTYDLRFVIAADRYDYRPPNGGVVRPRSIEDLKDRYYGICRRLLRTRTASDPQAQQQVLQSYAFDKQREIKRKQYSSELFHLTSAEIAEEEALYVEVKRLEQNERRYRADRDDLMRTVLGLDSGLVEFDQASAEALGFTKKRKRPDDFEGPASPIPVTKKQKESAAFDIAHGIYRVPSTAVNISTSHLASKHPIHLPAHLRSTKIALPRPTAAIRIAELLTELNINSQKLVMPTRANLEVFDRLLLAAGGLIDMKRQVDRVEQEIRNLKAQQQGYVPPVTSRKTRSLSVTSTDTSATGRRSRQ